MNGGLSVHNLRCEYRTDPIGIDIPSPRLSWQLSSERRGVRQSAYRVIIADSLAPIQANKGNVWDSRRVTSDRSSHVKYQGPALQSGRRYYWKVIVWDRHDRRSSWSDIAIWEMGLLRKDDWLARWISADLDQDSDQMQPAPHFRKPFMVDRPIAQARLYATALGCYELFLDGKRVGDEYFLPGWTSYQHHVQVQTFDVTDRLSQGLHTVGAVLADGWFRGNLANFAGPGRKKYGDQLAFLMQLVITYPDGDVQTVVSDESWRALDGEIRWSDIYMGECIDRRRALGGWSEPTYDDQGWAGVTVVDTPDTHLVAQVGPPVRQMKTLPATAIHAGARGEIVVDFGQNIVGWVELQAQGPAGTEITLHHAEVLDQSGQLYLDNLRTAKQRVTYILSGDGREQLTPRFSFQGFRYVAISGYPGDLSPEDINGVALYSDMAETGSFSCSHERVNQLQKNIVWGQRGNFLDVPTDCPQRDERLGWTGDAQVFIRTAAFNMDVAGFFTRWLQNLSADQRQDGALPHVSPNVLGDDAAGATGWADAGIICPWTLYLCYGDARILAQHFPMMQRWVAYMFERAGEDFIWRGDFHFGDWLATDRDDLNTPFGVTETDLIATAYFAYSTTILSRIAAILNQPDHATAYSQIADQVKHAFCQEFVTPNGRVGTNTQTAYVLALMFDLLPEPQRAEAARRLVADIRRRDTHLSTGFLGTPYICHVLTRFGYLDVAYELLLQETCPSWLYPITQGATTIWERWDGIRPDGSFQNADMNSFNHYAYGAIGHWLYSVVAGLEVDEAIPGYKHLRIQPQPGGGLTHARAALETMYGRVSSSWRWEDNHFRLEVDIPANATGTISLPCAALDEIWEGEGPVAQADGVTAVTAYETHCEIEVGSGLYQFQHPLSLAT